MVKKIAAFGLAALCAPAAFAQSADSPVVVSPDSAKISKAAVSTDGQTGVSRENRQQAYAKLLEGQRIVWTLSRRSEPLQTENRVRLARESFQTAVSLDPNLAEAYTALAELVLNSASGNTEEAISLASRAVKINPDNYGGHILLARLYTLKSGINRGNLKETATAGAISEWKEIARLDPRNAEAHAFLSELYGKTNRGAERIDALEKWLAASMPLDARFYQTVMGRTADLSPESAALKLGEEFLDAGRTKEAVEILSRFVAENPENAAAVELLGQSIEAADVDSAVFARQSLTQAVYANPENVSLISLLAKVESRAGNDAGAAKILRDFSAKFAPNDKISASVLQIALGDIFDERDRFDEAVAAYENALRLRGIGSASMVEDAERDFTIRVFARIIQIYKKTNRTAAAENLIERARGIFGKQDLFPDRQLIAFYRETGKLPEALRLVRALRAGRADDYGLLRLEANILTDSGKVDQAVALIKPLIDRKNTPKKSASIETGAGETLPNSSPQFDDFTNYIFISNLFAGAKRGTAAVEAANGAVSAGRNDEEKQIAQLTLATAYQTSGNFSASENILRELLKQSPRNPFALNNLGYFLVERGANLDEALNLIERAVKIDPTNPSYLDSLGWAFFKLGKFELAEKHLKAAARIDDSSPNILEHLGDVYHKQGKFAPAKSVWQRSADLSVEAEQIARLKTKLNSSK